jgi:hypothetical protein
MQENLGMVLNFLPIRLLSAKFLRQLSFPGVYFSLFMFMCLPVALIGTLMLFNERVNWSEKSG